MDGYGKYKEAITLPPTPVSLKMTRNVFCEQVLGAKLTNSRWGWVGVKEGEDNCSI